MKLTQYGKWTTFIKRDGSYKQEPTVDRLWEATLEKSNAYHIQLYSEFGLVVRLVSKNGSWVYSQYERKTLDSFIKETVRKLRKKR